MPRRPLLPTLTLLLLATLARAGDLPHAPCLDATFAARGAAREGLLAARAFGARWPGAGESAGPADFTILAHEEEWDANGVVADGPDTLVVPVGARVRWHRAVGLHTITDGRGLADPAAGARFDYLLDEAHPDFDTTFGAPDTIPFFCAFHDPSMRGVLVVSASAGVEPLEPPVALRFSRPPIPNPGRSVVLLSVGLPAGANVRLDVRDIQGRRLATLHDGALPAGEHQFRWRTIGADGRAARAGVYFAWLTDGTRVMTRRFSVLR